MASSPKFRKKDDHVGALRRRSANFFLKGQLRGTFSFVGHMGLYSTLAPLCEHGHRQHLSGWAGFGPRAAVC